MVHVARPCVQPPERRSGADVVVRRRAGAKHVIFCCKSRVACYYPRTSCASRPCQQRQQRRQQRQWQQRQWQQRQRRQQERRRRRRFHTRAPLRRARRPAAYPGERRPIPDTKLQPPRVVSRRTARWRVAGGSGALHPHQPCAPRPGSRRRAAAHLAQLCVVGGPEQPASRLVPRCRRAIPGGSGRRGRVNAHARHRRQVPCPALPCPALPCPALPCPALPCCIS